MSVPSIMIDPIAYPIISPRKAMMSTITVLDLFTGAGGLTRGWHDAADELGYKTEIVGSVELDATAALTYAENFGATGQFVGPIEEWLREVNTPEAEVILGGPPCQGFSTLGKRDINDVRNILWKWYAETIVRARPKYFIVENVLPFLKSAEYEAFKKSTEAGGILEAYELVAHRLAAPLFGSPQNRKRAVVIGRRKDAPSVKPPTITHPTESDWVKVRQAFKDIDPMVDGIQLPDRRSSSGAPGPFLTSELHLGRTYTQKSLERFAWIPEGGNRFNIPDELLAPCWRKSPTGYSDVMGRLHEEKPSVTIRTEFDKPEKGRYLHPTAHRAITHREAARLQGFPDDFKWFGSKPQIAKQIGNAVPVQLAEAISTSVIAAVQKARSLTSQPVDDNESLIADAG